jgi:DNA topoisomerase-3
VADGYRGPLAVKVEHCRQGPPKLFDLPSLQKTCGQRWGWIVQAHCSTLLCLGGKRGVTIKKME